MKRELGDICWYLAQACMALDTTFDEIIEMNVEKLKARYPGGEFDVHKSENRKEGDYESFVTLKIININRITVDEASITKTKLLKRKMYIQLYVLKVMEVSGG